VVASCISAVRRCNVALLRPVLIAYRLCSGFRKGQVTYEAGVFGLGACRINEWPHPSEESLGWGHLSQNHLPVARRRLQSPTHTRDGGRCVAPARISRGLSAAERQPSLRERPIHHKGIGAEILSAVAESWRLQHEAWVVQHTSVREAVHELKRQTAILVEILELLRSRTP
jgi:hypothetical protein